MSTITQESTDVDLEVLYMEGLPPCQSVTYCTLRMMVTASCEQPSVALVTLRCPSGHVRRTTKCEAHLADVLRGGAHCGQCLRPHSEIVDVSQ